MLSRKRFEHNNRPSRTHSFDTGAAWMNFSLQGALDRLVVHGMEGFDYEKMRIVLNVPDEFEIEAMCAVGRPGKRENLPPELLEREEPSDRKPLEEFVVEGGF